ncbi:hypothetical protein BKA81DRAFT_410183 [Phyllosticta paracitricarpa]|uniref:EF-hand domain-containing protein n=1 Tax=Phyllosticta paracitricarpa TaxID=2016321 RepID=A0ABR1MUA1_9PEZI
MARKPKSVKGPNPLKQRARQPPPPREPAPAPPKKTFTVDQRAMDLVEIMFHRVDGSAPGEVKWTDLLHLMRCMGYITTKREGSQWRFKSTDDEELPPVTFHDMHGQPVPIRRLWENGRYLRNHFGWDVDSFVLASPEEPSQEQEE